MRMTPAPLEPRPAGHPVRIYTATAPRCPVEEIALLTAESGEARATYDLYLATAELARALGRPIPMPATSRAPTRRTNE